MQRVVDTMIVSAFAEGAATSGVVYTEAVDKDKIVVIATRVVVGTALVAVGMMVVATRMTADTVQVAVGIVVVDLVDSTYMFSPST